MKNLLKKFRENKKGFTLAELLVVVAIISILVAISVPIFTSQLNKARIATNQANLRAAKVAAVTQYLNDDTINAEATAPVTYEYDLADGTVSTASVPSGKSALPNGIEGASGTTVYKTIYVTITPDGKGATTISFIAE